MKVVMNLGDFHGLILGKFNQSESIIAIAQMRY